ncbi:MAG: hypothetical protein AAB243_04875, partial [Planctomycetota bacterium]
MRMLSSRAKSSAAILVIAPPTIAQMANSPTTSTTRTKNSPKSIGERVDSTLLARNGTPSLKERQTRLITKVGEALIIFTDEKNEITTRHQAMLASKPKYPSSTFLGSNAILKARRMSR